MNASITRTLVGAAMACAAITATATAWAGEGRFEINQDCALAGCFPGDSAGYPVTIASSGSYVLVSNLSPAATGFGVAVQIQAAQADWIDLDLNGYTIDGSGSCVGTPVTSCSGSVGANAVGFQQLAGSDQVLLRLHNGVVRGFGDVGVLLHGNAAAGAPLASGSVIENLTITENALDGLGIEYESGMHVVIRDVRLIRNGRRGAGAIEHSDGSADFRNVLAYGNGTVGLAAQHGSTIVGSRFVRNGTSGLACGGSVSPCTLAIGDSSFAGNLVDAYFVPVLRSMGNIVCIEAACP